MIIRSLICSVFYIAINFVSSFCLRNYCIYL